VEFCPIKGKHGLLGHYFKSVGVGFFVANNVSAFAVTGETRQPGPTGDTFYKIGGVGSGIELPGISTQIAFDSLGKLASDDSQATRHLKELNFIKTSLEQNKDFLGQEEVGAYLRGKNTPPTGNMEQDLQKVYELIYGDFIFKHTAYYALCYSLIAFGLAHRGNVSLQEHCPRQPKRKSTRNHRYSPVRYYTLDIGTIGRRLREKGGLEVNGLAKAMHLCRGHFATYSPERPLFGRTSGTFWIPAHVRGGDDSRCVVKDYSVGREPAAPTPDYSEAAVRFPAGTQVVYFLQAESGGPIKIGETSNLQQRMKDLQQAEPLTLLHAFPGDRDCEQWIHRELSRHRRLGEWFDPHTDVLELIEEAKRLDFKSTTEARERFIPLRIREAQCACSTAPTCT